MSIDLAPRRYENRGSGTVGLIQPYNPKEGHVWSDSVSGKDYRFSAGSWVTVESLSTTTGVIDISSGGTGASTASAARTNLGIGTLGTQASSNVFLNGQFRTGSVVATAISLSLSSQTVCIASASGITITLPNVVGADAGLVVYVKNTSGGSLTVTSGALIDGAANNTLLAGVGAVYIADGANWWRFA